MINVSNKCFFFIFLEKKQAAKEILYFWKYILVTLEINIKTILEG